MRSLTAHTHAAFFKKKKKEQTKENERRHHRLACRSGQTFPAICNAEGNGSDVDRCGGLESTGGRAGRRAGSSVQGLPGRTHPFAPHPESRCRATIAKHAGSEPARSLLLMVAWLRDIARRKLAANNHIVHLQVSAAIRSRGGRREGHIYRAMSSSRKPSDLNTTR